MTIRLNTLNFIPSRTERGPWSVVFGYNGAYRERRFDTEEAAKSFASKWEKSEVTYMPLYINARTMEEHK